MPGTMAGNPRYKIPVDKNNVLEVTISLLYHGVYIKTLNKMIRLLVEFVDNCKFPIFNLNQEF